MTKFAAEIAAHRYKRHRFPAEIIAHAVWFYHRFPLSEDLLAGRGIDVSFQIVSEWATKFSRKSAFYIRRRSRGHFADKWHLDEGVRRGTRSSVGAELHER